MFERLALRRLARWIPAPVRRPSGVVDSMRWLFLLAVISCLLLCLPAPLSVANATTGPLALGSAAVLLCSWIWGYRRRRSWIGLDVIDAVAMGAFALACPAPALVFSFVFSALWYRSLYGSFPRAMITCAIYSAGLCAVQPLWTLVPNGFPAPPPGVFAGTVPVMFLVTAVARSLAVSLFLRAESARRDAALASLGTTLLGLGDRSEILARTNDAVAEICAATPGLRSIAVFPQPDGVAAAFPNGEFAELPTALPDDVVEMAPDGTPLAVRRTDLLNALAGATCVWQAIPAPDSTSGAYVLLGAPKRVRAEAVLTMTSLLNQVTFAIRNYYDRQRLTEQARTDALTGLANRAAFTEQLADAAGRVSILFLDLDEFKPVNDLLGHAAGDRLLQVVSARLTATAGPGAFCARFGGDEFAVMVVDAPDAEVDRLAEEIVTAVGEPVPVAGVTAAVGASVGIAVSLPGPVDPDALLRAADQAMYAAKTAGRNRVCRYVGRTATAVYAA